MNLNDERIYGERIAEIYDDLYANYEETMIDRLHELAGGGRGTRLKWSWEVSPNSKLRQSSI
jgi:hypothetical protein